MSSVAMSPTNSLERPPSPTAATPKMTAFSGSGHGSPTNESAVKDAQTDRAAASPSSSSSVTAELDIPRFVLSPASLAIHDKQQEEQQNVQPLKNSQLAPLQRFSRDLHHEGHLSAHGQPHQHHDCSLPSPSCAPYSVDIDLDTTSGVTDLEQLSASSMSGLNEEDDGNERDDELSDDGNESPHLSITTPQLNDSAERDPFFEATEASFIVNGRPVCSKTQLVSCLSSRSASPGVLSPLLSDDEWPASAVSASSSSLSLPHFSRRRPPTASSVAAALEAAHPDLSSSPESSVEPTIDVKAIAGSSQGSVPARSVTEPSGYASSASNCSYSSGGTRVRFKRGCVISEVNLTWAAESYDRHPILVAESLDMHRCHSIDVDGANADEEAEHWQMDDEGIDDDDDAEWDSSEYEQRRVSGKNSVGWGRDPLVAEEDEERIPRRSSPSYEGIADDLSLCRVSSRTQARPGYRTPYALSRRTSYDNDQEHIDHSSDDDNADLDAADNDDDEADTKTVLSVSPAPAAMLHSNPKARQATSLQSAVTIESSVPIASSASEHHTDDEEEHYNAFSCASSAYTSVSPIFTPAHSPLQMPALKTYDGDAASSASSVDESESEREHARDLALQMASAFHDEDDRLSQWMKMACAKRAADLQAEASRIDYADDESVGKSSNSAYADLVSPSPVRTPLAVVQQVSPFFESPAPTFSSASTTKGHVESDVAKDEATAQNATPCPLKRLRAKFGTCAMGKFSREQLQECDALGGF